MSDLKHYDYDLFTIGAGSGGVSSSRLSARFGLKSVYVNPPESEALASFVAAFQKNSLSMRACIVICLQMPLAMVGLSGNLLFMIGRLSLHIKTVKQIA